MISYSIPKDLKMPIYQYLYSCIKEDMINGKIKASEKLPSKRALAKQLQVSLITIENAYNQLAVEGYITPIEKKGYFVNEIERIEHKQASKPLTIKEEKGEEYQVDLTRALSSTQLFPFGIWSKLSRKVLSENKEEILQAHSFKGVLSLRQAIASHLKGFFNMDVDASQIIIGSGSEYLYSLIIQLLGRERVYGLEDPGYNTVALVYGSNEIKYEYIDLDDEGIDVKKLRKGNASVVHVTTNHHYPTGITMPINRRNQLLKWASDKNGYIVEDDYDSEFRLKGKLIPPLFSLANNERVIYLNTFSITLSSSLRIAYMVLPLPLLKVYEEKLSFYRCTVPVYEQLVLAQFIEQRYFERHINRMRKKYQENREEFFKLFNELEIAKELKIKEADSGLHFLLEHPYKISDELLEKEAEKIGLHVYTLSKYSHKKKDSHTILVRYSSLNDENCQQTVNLLAKLFSNLKGLTNVV